jgi:hypothetical protein
MKYAADDIFFFFGFNRRRPINPKPDRGRRHSSFVSGCPSSTPIFATRVIADRHTTREDSPAVNHRVTTCVPTSARERLAGACVRQRHHRGVPVPKEGNLIQRRKPPTPDAQQRRRRCR